MFTLRKSALLIVVGLLLLSVGVAAAKPKNPPSHGRHIITQNVCFGL